MARPVMVILLCGLLTQVTSSSVQAAQSANAARTIPRLATALYPSGTQLTYQEHLSNEEMDFDWGFVCDCHPGSVRAIGTHVHSLFHVQTQDQLRRSGGWSEAGTINQGHRFTQFTLYASQYVAGNDGRGVPWSQGATDDLELAVRLRGYRPLARFGRLVSSDRSATVLVMYRYYGSVSVLLLASQLGTQEVEGMVTSTVGPALQEAMWEDLVQQMRAAQLTAP